MGINDFLPFPLMEFKRSPNPIYLPKRSQVIKNKRRKAHTQRTKRR